jgi:hypothetical protein
MVQRHLAIMFGFMPNIHVFPFGAFKDVDGRDKPDHDAQKWIPALRLSLRRE